MSERKSKRIADGLRYRWNKDGTQEYLPPISATPEIKSSNKEKVVEYISDYTFKDGGLQFRVKWKGFPESSCDWKKCDFFRNEDLKNLLKNFLKDYKNKYLLYCTDKNQEKDLLRDDIGFEEAFAKMSLFGAPKYSYKNKKKTFKFTSDYEIKKFKTKKLLKMEKFKIKAALAPNLDIEIENEVDVKYFPLYLKWNKNYTGLKPFSKAKISAKNSETDIRSCKCKYNCIIQSNKGKTKKPIECCLSPENSYKLDGRVRFVSKDFMLNECDSTCQCDETKCLNRVVQKGSNCKLCVFRTLNKGWGVKTKIKIKKGTYISEYCGDIVNKDEHKKRMKKYEELENSYFFDLRDRKGKATGFFIDPTVFGNEARFFNHSCKPNMQLLHVNTDKESKFSRIAFFAKFDIEEEEELTWDYNGDFLDYLDCKCGHCKK